MTILSTLESTALDETIKCASKCFEQKNPQNLKLNNLKSVTYAQPIPLVLRGSAPLTKQNKIACFVLYLKIINTFLKNNIEK